MIRLRALVVSGLLFLVSTPAILACSTCFGDSSSQLTKGATVGMTFLLVVILSVLGGVIAFFVFLAKRSQMSAAAPITDSVSNHEHHSK
jgi:hypothetical protein